MIYTAARGDTWDSIAYKAFGDEFFMPQIMEANRKYSGVVIFDGGERVTIPDQVYIESAIISTPWQTGAKIAVITAPWG